MRILFPKSNFFLAEFGEIFNLSQTKTPNSERFLAFEIKIRFFQFEEYQAQLEFRDQTLKPSL